MTQIAPIKKVFDIIDSYQNKHQLRTCVKLADFYSQMVKEKGIINHDLVKETLYIKINERKKLLELADQFTGKIRRRKVTFQEIEQELIENF